MVTRIKNKNFYYKCQFFICKWTKWLQFIFKNILIFINPLEMAINLTNKLIRDHYKENKSINRKFLNHQAVFQPPITIANNEVTLNKICDGCLRSMLVNIYCTALLTDLKKIYWAVMSLSHTGLHFMPLLHKIFKINKVTSNNTKQACLQFLCLPI